VRGGGGQKAVGRRGYEFGQTRPGLRRIEAATHEVDARLFGRGGFLGGFDVDVGEAALAVRGYPVDRPGLFVKWG
jgi:hypothetical protein